MMRRKNVLFMLLSLMAIPLLTYTSADGTEHTTANKMKVALIVSKRAHNDIKIDRINTGGLLDAEEAGIPDQNNPYDHFNHGVACDHDGKHREAIESYRKAVSIKPDYPEAHYNLALSYLMLNENALAHEEYRFLKNIDPQMADNLYEKTFSMALSNPDNKYFIQVGAYRNIENANAMMEKLRADYLYAHIEKGDSFNKVRILGIKNMEEGTVMLKDIRNKFKIVPFLLPAH
jgi:tetratricopeptide (TPR) repeat protein